MSNINVNALLGSMLGSSNATANSSNRVAGSSAEAFSKSLEQAKSSGFSKRDLNVRNNINDKSSNVRENKNEDRQVSKKDDQYKDNKPKVKDQTNNKVENEKADSKTKDINEKVSGDEEKSVDEKLNDDVLALMSQALNLPIEEIKVNLEELGLNVQDLMSEEGFGAFISNQLGDGNALSLLGNENIKELTSLFDQLTALSNVNEEATVKTFSKADLLNQLLETKVAQDDTMGAKETLGEEAMKVTFQNQLSPNAMTRADQNLVNNDRYHNESNDQLTFVAENATQTESLGINVPVHNFTSTSFTQSFITEDGQMTQVVTTKQDISGQDIIKQIDFKLIGQAKELTVKLSPKELGDLNIKIVENNGALVAEIKVDNDKAKEFIQSEIHLLKENLESQGINITDVKVDINQDNGRSQMEQEKQKSSKRIQQIMDKHFGEAEEELEELAPIVSDSEVDYSV